MEIKYRDTKDFDAKDIERLFLSVKWDSGKYPGKLVRGMHNSTHVVSACCSFMHCVIAAR